MLQRKLILIQFEFSLLQLIFIFSFFEEISTENVVFNFLSRIKFASKLDANLLGRGILWWREKERERRSRDREREIERESDRKRDRNRERNINIYIYLYICMSLLILHSFCCSHLSSKKCINAAYN